MSLIWQVNPGPIYRAVKPIRDPQYLRFLKKLPCVACLKTWQIDPAHTGPHAHGKKACDLKAIPLCRPCHNEFDAAPYVFAEQHGLDIPALILKFNEFYKAKIKREAA